MKTKLSFLLFILSFFTMLKAQELPINLIGFQSLSGQNTSNIIRWEIESPENANVIATQVNSILVANSTFNASTGDFIAKVNISNVTGILEFNTLNENFEFNSATIATNGSSECDMQTGNIYTYDNNSQNQKVFKKYIPSTNEYSEIGTFNFPNNASFYPDSSCFDSNLGIYYFVMSDNSGLKLISVPVNNTTFAYSEVLITGLPVLGNIGLEFSNDSNTIFATFAANFGNNQNYVFNVGKISSLGVLESLMALPTISSYQFFNRTFDQASNSIIFIGSEQNETKLFVYDTDTNTYTAKLLPTGNLNEIECNNYNYSQQRFGPLKTKEFNLATQMIVNQNLKTITFSDNLLGKKFDIFSVTGSKVASQVVLNSLSFDYSSLPSGIYIIQMDGLKSKISRKIIL